jgi:hypothetical protein
VIKLQHLDEQIWRRWRAYSFSCGGVSSEKSRMTPEMKSTEAFRGQLKFRNFDFSMETSFRRQSLRKNFMNAKFMQQSFEGIIPRLYGAKISFMG